MLNRKPYAYLRRSHAGPANHNGRVSFESQRSAVLDMAARRGDTEPELIVDWGLSGAAAGSTFGGTGRGGKRRAYLDLRAAIDAGHVSALYAYSLSRLARSTRELLDLAEACVARNVPIRLAKEGDIDGTSPSGRLYLTVLAAVATFEAEVAAERARDRNDAMRERGAVTGRNPFGYLIDDGRLVPDPATAPTLRRVLALHGKLKSPAKVAKALNAEGIVAPQGGTWRDGTIRRILARQPGYRPPETIRGSRAVPTATFARLVFCHCGSTMTPSRSKYKTASGERREQVSYTCQAARYGTGHIGPKTVAETVVLAAAQAEAALLALPDQYVTEANAEAQRAELNARRGVLLDALEHGTFTRAEVEPRLALIADEFAAIEAQTEVVDIPPIDWSWPPESLNPALRALWERVELDPDGGVRRPFVWTVPEWRAP